MRNTGRAIRAPGARRRRGRRRPLPLRARDLLFRYISAIFILLLSLVIPILVPVVYVGAGIMFSRYISRHSRLTIFYNNFDASAKVKIRMVLYWPWELPGLMWRVALVRHL